MQRIASRIVWQFSLLFLLLLPGFVLAGTPVPEDYLAGKSLVLEIRYCECQATKSESAPSELLPSFLKESHLLKVGVASEDKGFVSSHGLSIGYEARPVSGSSDQSQFSYSGNYTTSNGSSAGNGELLLVQGQWLTLFGSQHESETGSQHSNVAVRLTKPDGSVE